MVLNDQARATSLGRFGRASGEEGELGNVGSGDFLDDFIGLRCGGSVKTCPKCFSSCPEEDAICSVCGATLSGSAAVGGDPYVGRVIARNFLLKERIGGGAMGSIYTAEQISLGKTICIKLLHPHLLGDSALAYRFEREARAASRLRHANIIQVIDFGQTQDGLLFMAMEYVKGVDLAQLLYKDFPLDPFRVIRIMSQVASALDEAHAMGVIHRDLKPENIMVEERRQERDFVKVLDFGIAKITNPDSSRGESFQTQIGIVCGTPEYMSPEQARGEKLDSRSDLYSLGVVLYQLLSDRLPFEGDTAIEIVTKHLKEPPTRPSLLRSDIPRELEELVLQLLEKDRELRPPSALTVRDELDKIAEVLSARTSEVGDRTIPGMTLQEVMGRYGSGGSGDVTLVSVAPNFDDLDAGSIPKAPAPSPPPPVLAESRGAMEITQPSPWPSPKPEASPERPTRRGREGESSRAASLERASAASVEESLLDTVPGTRRREGFPWAVLALALVALGVIALLSFLFFTTGGPSSERASSAADVVSPARDDVPPPTTGTPTTAPPATRPIESSASKTVVAVADRGGADVVSSSQDVNVDSGGADSGGADSGGADSGGADSGGAKTVIAASEPDVARADRAQADRNQADHDIAAVTAPPERRQAQAGTRRPRARRDPAASKRLESEGDKARRAGNYSEAIRRFKAALKAHPRGILLKKLGQCYNALDDFDSGARYLRKYLKLLPDDDPRRAILERQIRK